MLNLCLHKEHLSYGNVFCVDRFYADEQKVLLKSLHAIRPDDFNNKLEEHDKIACCIVVFNEYVKKVAIPKGWDFTKTVMEWPTNEISNDEFDLFKKVLEYLDFIHFAMEI